MAATPIDYVCVRAEHNRMLFPARAVYAVHEGRWAYCPSGAVGAHEWISAGGANLSSIGQVGVRVPAARLERDPHERPGGEAREAVVAADGRRAEVG
ncbi:MAG: hypothetical protein ABR525_07290 [Candidatus Limnocylindria bacterium]